MPQDRTTSALIAALAIGTSAFAAEPAPATKKAFMELETTYVSFEITEVGSQDFSSPKDGLTDGAYRANHSLKFELPFNMPLPGSCPTTLPPEEAMEEGRCAGWTYMPPDDPAIMDQLMSGKVVLSENPMFSPAEFSVDDVIQSRYRDLPSDGWATETRTYKGKGLCYVTNGGMLLCDFKRLTCDLANLSFACTDGKVAITTTSDVPGFEPKEETQEPRLMLPQIPQEIVSQMAGFPLTLPGPITLTFSGQGEARGYSSGTNVVVKMTVSSKPGTTAGTRSSP